MTDARLARRAAKGDQRAFAAIFDRYQQELYRFCLSILGNPEDARDALQNTMLKALQALPGEERQIQLKPWLYRVAHNEAIEIVRKRRETASVEPELAATGAGLAETAAQRERLRQLLSDLADLPERQRAALVMRELGGLGFEQIAEAFESSPAVARQTVYEARLNLRSLEEGREMSCGEVMHRLSNNDGRVRRRRDLQAHLRVCADCRAFGDAIETRRGDFAALAPLPAIASAGILQAVLGGAHGAAASSAAGTGSAGVAVGAGKAIGAGVVAKSVATVAVVAAVGVTAADRSGLVHTGLGGDTAAQQSSAASQAGGATPAAANGASSGTDSSTSGGTGGKHGGAASQAGGKGKNGETATAGAEDQPPASRHGQEMAASHGNGATMGHGRGRSGAAHGASHPGHHAPHRGASGHAKAKGGSPHPQHPVPPANPPRPPEKTEPAPEAAPKAEQPSSSTGKSTKSSAEPEGMP